MRLDLRAPWPDAEDLEEILDGSLPGLATAPVWGSASYDDVVTLRQTTEGATPQQRWLYAVQFCDSEILNGGFRQLLWNPTGILIPWAVEGLRAIGSPDVAHLHVRALAVLGDRGAVDDNGEWYVQDVVDSLPRDAFRSLDDAYYAVRHVQGADLDERQTVYVREHPELFFKKVRAVQVCRPYSPNTEFGMGDEVEHSKFGTGKVVRVGSRDVEVAFPEGLRKLVHRRT